MRSGAAPLVAAPFAMLQKLSVAKLSVAKPSAKNPVPQNPVPQNPVPKTQCQKPSSTPCRSIPALTRRDARVRPNPPPPQIPRWGWWFNLNFGTSAERGFGGMRRVFRGYLRPGQLRLVYLSTRLSAMALASTGTSSPSTPPSLGVAQKVGRRGEPLLHLGVPQAIEQHLHRLVDRPLGPLINCVGQQRPRPHQSAQIDARHAQSPRRRRHAAAFVEKLSLDSPEANGERSTPAQLHWSFSPSRRCRSRSWRSRIIPRRHETVSDHRRSSRRPGLGCNLTGPPSSNSRNFWSRASRATSRSTGEPLDARYPIPSPRQQRRHIGFSCSFSTRAGRPHAGQTKKLQLPLFGNSWCVTRTSRANALSPSPKVTMTDLVSAVTTPDARNREIVGVVGRSS